MTKRTMRVGILICVFGLVGFGCYRKGYADSDLKAAERYNTEYGNDWNSDPSAKHSVSYSMGYARGHSDGWGESRQKDVIECGDKLAEVVVRAGSTKIAGELLVEGYVGPSQLEAADAKYGNPTSPRH
jgi:hypothetical protein